MVHRPTWYSQFSFSICGSGIIANPSMYTGDESPVFWYWYRRHRHALRYRQHVACTGPSANGEYFSSWYVNMITLILLCLPEDCSVLRLPRDSYYRRLPVSYQLPGRSLPSSFYWCSACSSSNHELQSRVPRRALERCEMAFRWPDDGHAAGSSVRTYLL